jgi:hypothetical protein
LNSKPPQTSKIHHNELELGRPVMAIQDGNKNKIKIKVV